MDTSKFRVPVPSKLGASVVLFMIFGGVIFEYLGNAASQLLPTPLSCDSPELFQEFQDRFASNVSQTRQGAEAEIARYSQPLPPLPANATFKEQSERTSLERRIPGIIDFDQKILRDWDGVNLHIDSTETLGGYGNRLSCRMNWNVGRGSGDPSSDNVFEFLLGRNDQGHLTWEAAAGSVEPYVVPDGVLRGFITDPE